jgi:hypothetical protein
VYAKTAGEGSDGVTEEGIEARGDGAEDDEEDEILPPPGMTIQETKEVLNLNEVTPGELSSLSLSFHHFSPSLTQLLNQQELFRNLPSHQVRLPNGPSRNRRQLLPPQMRP